MKLTNIAIKNAKPKDKNYHLPDGDNLSLLVTTTPCFARELVSGRSNA